MRSVYGLEPRIDPLAQAFAGVAEGYERGRPAVPARAGRLGVAEARPRRLGTVIDLAAGTGKLSRMLVPRAPA